MLRRKFFIGLALLFALAGAQSAALAKGKTKKAARETTFKVRIENISGAEGQTAKDGTKWPFALSPGLYVIDEKGGALFRQGKRAGGGLEAQAEDGNPSGIAQALEATHHSAALHGVFNTPVGADAPGPIGPGGAYEFTVNATPKMKLTLITMFGQSNDYFYAPERPIALFDAQGNPVSGDVTSSFVLFDAGTEVDQELGVGPDQAPRQKAPNTGADENGVVHRATKDAFYSRTPQLFRVTITPVS